MHTEHKREDPIVDLGYETRDLNYPVLGKVAFYFTIFALFCFGSVGVWFTLDHPNTNSVLDPHKPMPPITVQSNIAVRADIQTLRQHESSILGSTGPNPDGTSHIPIDQAMNLIAKRGLPHTETAVPATSPGNTIKQNALAPGEKPALSGPIGGATTP